jgi:cell cycle arrest protein BUB3
LVPNSNSDTSGYATASVEGRIAVEYFDPSPTAQEKKYAFKCHRQTIADVDHVWPVNSLAFHPTFNTFASAGSDGTVSIWDHKVKKRLRQYPKFPGPVAAVAFNCDGRKVAVGVSYTWDEGEKGLKTNPVAPWLGVRMVGEEVKVRFVFVCLLYFLSSLLWFFLQRANRESRHMLCANLH